MDKPPPAPPKPTAPPSPAAGGANAATDSPKVAARLAREAAALRANLRKRKDQARAQTAAHEPPEE